MLLIPISKGSNIDLLIILEQDNIDRIQEYDPAEVIWSQLPPAMNRRLPGTIAVTYATAQEVKKIQELAQAGEVGEILEMVTRGWKFRPDRGDHDFGPVSLRNKGRVG